MCIELTLSWQVSPLHLVHLFRVTRTADLKLRLPAIGGFSEYFNAQIGWEKESS